MEKTEKLAIFGGTGRTGKLLVEQALTRGYQATLLTRDPGKMNIHNPKLEIIQGDVTDLEAVERVVTGADAVISVLGPASNEPVFEISQGMENILKAMKKQGASRLIMTAGAGVGDPKDEPRLFNRLMNTILKLAARNVLEDMTRAVKIARSSGLDWTVVRLPMLTDTVDTEELKVGYLGKGVGGRVSRPAAAGFLLDQVKSSKYIRESPVISH